MPEHNLPAGAVGTVVMDHTKHGRSDLPPAYEVEFTDSQGNTEAVVTVLEGSDGGRLGLVESPNPIGTPQRWRAPVVHRKSHRAGSNF